MERMQHLPPPKTKFAKIGLPCHHKTNVGADQITHVILSEVAVDAVQSSHHDI